jgi:hypothetical protein
MVAALVRWSFGALARRLLACLLEQALLDKLCLAPVMEGEEGDARCLRLLLLFVVVARLSNELFVFFITFRNLCTVIDDY